MRLQTFYLILAALIYAPLHVQAQQPASRNGRSILPARVPAGVKAYRDLAYVRNGHQRQRLDLYVPEKAKGPLPLLIWIHGGGWRNGSKAGCMFLRQGFAAEGYAIASLDYRLSGDALFPAQIEDCKAAVRWLRAHAADYGLDPKRFGVGGSSAGGHLAALLGTTRDHKGFDVGDHLDQSSAVQAVIDFFGPTDLLQMDAHRVPGGMAHDQPESAESLLIGGPIQRNKDRTARANPIEYVTQADPPLLMVHGDNDRTVPPHQSLLLYEAYDTAELPVGLHYIAGAGHGGPEFDRPEIITMVRAFFNRYLKDGHASFRLPRPASAQLETIRGRSPQREHSGGQAQATPAKAPYPPSPVIAGITLDWATHQRHALGSDNWQLTWADDDHQYGAWGDGGGFGADKGGGRVGLGYARIEGDWASYKGFNVWGGKAPEHPAQFEGKSWGTICVDGVLYSWVIPDLPDTGGPRDHYRYIELARSTDHGAHWTKAPWRWRIEDNLIIPTFIVNGKNNAHARDEFVYSYFIRPHASSITHAQFGLEAHKPGALFLARVHKDRIFTGRDAYEWFTGMNGGRPAWGSLAEKRPVFEDPDGTGWCVSASYNLGLRRYLLATEHGASHSSVMGVFDAPEPWGPWTTVKYWTPSERFGQSRPGSTLDWADNIFFFSFAPKWFSADGRSFTLVFTGGGRGKNNDSMNTVRGSFQLREQT